jgi:very-short-patch-repair endonuclease
MYEYRTLTADETVRADEQRKGRTSAEKEAYRLLPVNMRERVERNGPVAFEGHKAFYPDLLFRNEKIIIEIDGGVHRKYEQQRIDKHRNGVFKDHGFHIIRILNEDVCVNIAFWQRVIEGLLKINSVENRTDVCDFIADLNELIHQETIRSVSRDDDGIGHVFFPKNQWKPLGRIQMRHELLLCV